MLSACCLLIMKGSVQTNNAPPKIKHTIILLSSMNKRAETAERAELLLLITSVVVLLSLKQEGILC